MAEELILRLKKKRAINRSYLTKTCNKIESGLDTLIRIDLEELLEQLNESFNELKLVDHEIETLLETDDLEKELQGVEEYREKYITWRFRANKKIRQSDFHGKNIPNSNSRIDENEMRHYVPSCTTVKLPKLIISKFYGNFSEWLTFWNSFDAAIHQNNSLNPIDKFNYLKSHLGGTALNTVEGFALSADNYEKAIKLLKDRFGREDILISRHMNNLLSMRPLKTSSDVRTFREPFDNLSVQIRSLESLNVSIDVYGQLLCPIIIKLLPADLNLELNKELPTGYVINDLITFLERQLHGRGVLETKSTRFYNEKPIATASELLNSVHKSNECVFCGKDNHGSPKCDFAANISLNEKRSLMKKKGLCYKCLWPSHLTKFCRNVVRCSICNMSSNLDVMCTKRILDRGGSSKSPTVQDETLANLSTSPDVLLPTLRVTLKGNRTEKTARAIIDTGSQRSYILHSTAMEMEYEQSRREFFRHSLFGGSSTDVVEHEVYTIHLSDINNSYRCEFEALGQPLICGSIPPVCPRSFLEGSGELDVSDLMRDRIEVLIGADIAGRLLTDDQRRISSGLVAIRTKLGWTVMGKIPPTEMRDDTSSLCVTTLLSLDLENLWKLDAIGVSDAEVEKKTQSLQAEMEEHFAHTTTRDIEGRYEVALPWVQDKEMIPSNRDLAENQLSSVRRKLEEVGDMNEYGQIFEEWMKQGIIEYAREDKLDGVDYLPHRPVYKRNSQTSRIRPVFNASARKRVFEIAGVDLSGHLILKNKKKAWIVIFTCAVYRGVHLELVTSLSMEAFIQAFRRFIARRGRPLIVYSDNGTNFRGMTNALKKIDFSRLKCDPTLKNITWKFIPPGAPWWGGWWERLIGMMKQLLFRILGQTSLGYEELSTVMCDVESLMNTRPLTYLIEESEDLAPLTPSLFLHEVREVGVPDLDLIDNKTLSRKYQYIKHVREDLRERFRIEYFGFLRQETRRLKTTIPFKVGDMVLIGQESLKRLHWPLARIIQLYPRKDGLVRVAKVKTSSGDKIRPIQKLYNLEITPEIRCRDPLTERSPTQEVRLTTEEDPLTSQQEQHHIETPNVVSSYGRPIKRPNRLDLLNLSIPCLSSRGANSKVGEMLEKKASEAANERSSSQHRVAVKSQYTQNIENLIKENPRIRLSDIVARDVVLVGMDNKSVTSVKRNVLLPTLRVTLKGNRTEKTARAIIDTGSQRSYILHSTAMEMEYEQSRREFFRHSLFGGSSTDVVEHEVYTIHLSDINNSYRCEFEALGQPLICGSIPPVCPRSFLEGSEELDVSDLMRDRIEVLIGADIAGRLLTDDQRRISSGLVAIRTKLGWTVMGKIPPTEMRDDTSSLCVTTLLSLDLENLWKLDAIGVSDAEVEKKTQSLQAEMEEHFAHTTTRDIEGCYEVALPWVQDKEMIPSNRDLAENQLSSVRRKLEEVGDMNEYGQTFEEWMKQGIIEYAREDKLDGVHYLPHRPMYKRNSQTSRIRPVFNASARKRVGVSSDIEKAFLQIGIKEEDRDAAVFEIAGVDLMYRGVHLELVTSLSMEAFIQAFRRFIARRGRPLIVYSDNGTNFRGMTNALKTIDFSRLKCDPTLKNITWKFIPPGAPWWGGWWERLIGMMKQLLFRILGQTSLGYEELSTVMCDVESLMNTRPLTYLIEESEDLAPLTPSLFLHEVREVGVPDLDLIDNKTLSRKYQYIKHVREDLRERFRIEYFGFLRQETRRLKTTIPFKVGDMVLIGQESLKRLHWPLARIIQLYPRKDGLVRVAKVKTSSGDKIRPIQKLYNLEITPEIRCRDPLTERSPTQEVRLTTEEDPLTSQQEQHHIETPNVVSSYGRPIKRPNRLDLLNLSIPCLSSRGANSKVGEMLEKKASEAANERSSSQHRVAVKSQYTQNIENLIKENPRIRLSDIVARDVVLVGMDNKSVTSVKRNVLLPTLRVTLKGNRTEKTARAIIDTGSQRSYILHSTAMEMEYEQSRREFFRHSLFGGSSTDVVEHEVYTIHLSDINNSYRCEFEALGQPLICGSIPPVCPRSFLEGSEELDVSDLMRDRIEVLIGADIAGRLLTDDQRRISSGLVAIRTKLGWTVMGKIPPTEMRDDTSSLCVTTLLSLDLENLWKLDAIGVSDAEVEKKTQSLQAEMEEHFAHTTTRDIEGCYEVALPWVQDKEMIPSNRDLAENQLSSVRRKLEEVGDMNEYGQTFEEWMKQGIIEYAREDKLDGVHYLPHRPMYKRNSQTSRIRPVFNASARKRVGVSSDIEKAFLQIGIKEEDRDAAVFEIAGVDLMYRGVHLELVTSLSMEAFIQAFRRFIARRGRPLIVYSDNGTNFRGMTNALKTIDFSRLKCDPTLKNITWKFIPPGAPWWGGWWERLIGMMKQLLFRILDQTSLGYEELSTVMCDVESLMNTRPLTYLTEESEDLAPLTPSLFLHEVREVGVPDLDLIDNKTLSRKYQYIKRVQEDLRERFRIEYFGFLRQETRRLKTTIPFKVGDMVLIGQESLKRLHWPLARIIQLYPRKDGLVRVAKVKTSSGDKIRPIQKLYNLEITPEIRCRDPLTERSPTQEVRLTTEEDPLTSQQEQHHIETPNVVSSYGRPIKRPNRLDLLNLSIPCLSRRGANSKVGEMMEKKASEAANGRPAEAATGMQRLK
ncbi:hypothetical protein LAZ67_20001094 [Cordylochernes scorpioides]|uniref:Integrase catalytic domain-containing protein n=1 Tax=Cordylochernes scorpioides TaxID=51811 RepID=A0ABY6LJM1_9ARAC|nr:hypothetical protein LAZ67_20001094 [Cordylochernes scorpioides]